jgi:hypothetical protein
MPEQTTARMVVGLSSILGQWFKLFLEKQKTLQAMEQQQQGHAKPLAGQTAWVTGSSRGEHFYNL